MEPPGLGQLDRLAYALLHGNVPNVSMNDPRVFHQGTYGDTDYYMIGARRLPVLMPLETAGVPGPLLAFFDAPLRVLIEWGHCHNINPGEPTGSSCCRLPTRSRLS